MERIEITDEIICREMKSLDEKILKALPDTVKLNHTFSPSYEQKIEKLFKREGQRRKYGFPIESWKRVAVVFVVMMIGILTATLSVDAIREKVFSYIETIYDTYTSKIFCVEGENVGGFVPIYPTYIPEGYTLAIEDVEKDGMFLSYETKDGEDCIVISQDLIYDQMNYADDSEYVKQEICTVQEAEATLGIKNNGTIRVRWEKNGYIYLVSATKLSKDEVIKVCESLK